jgi:hypothetical protein
MTLRYPLMTPISDTNHNKGSFLKYIFILLGKKFYIFYSMLQKANSHMCFCGVLK